MNRGGLRLTSDTKSDKVLWYIWQQKNPNQICASSSGFAQPGPAMPGESKIEEAYNLFVGPGDGDIKANLST